MADDANLSSQNRRQQDQRSSQARGGGGSAGRGGGRGRGQGRERTRVKVDRQRLADRIRAAEPMATPPPPAQATGSFFPAALSQQSGIEVTNVPQFTKNNAKY